MTAPKPIIKIQAESELMKNQKHAAVMGSQQDFQVLQTAEGDAIFFSIGTDGIFYVTCEVRGSASGWDRTDLSSPLLSTKSTRGKAKSFVVSQNPQTSAIDVALVMDIDGSNFLYLSRNNPVSSDSWAKGIPWKSIPFDAVGSDPAPFVISDLYMLTRPAGKDADQDVGILTWFVDIARTPGDGSQSLERYCIEPEFPVKWIKHIFPNDVEAESISSCLGRRKGDRVDGIYTMGKTGASQSLIYTPTKNVSSPDVFPSPVRLSIPRRATGMSSCSDKDGLTNLFVAGDDGLYLFSPDEQKDGAEPSLIIPSAPVSSANTFAGASSLKSSTVGSRTVVWGRNPQLDLIYSTCQSGREVDPGQWSPPMRISSDVTRFAFYLNRMTSGNVLFVLIGDDRLLQLTQGEEESVWIERRITLLSTDVSQMFEATTYTTLVKCTDQNGMPAPGSGVTIVSQQGAAMTINNNYRKLIAGLPMEIKADGMGSITIVQETSALPAVCFTIFTAGQTLPINPQSKVVQRLSTIKSGDDLSKVSITDSKGRTRPLVPSDVSQADRDSIAKCLPKLLEAHITLPADGSRIAGIPTASDAETAEDATFWGVVSDSNQLKFWEGEEALEKLGECVSSEYYSILSSPTLSTGGILDNIATSAADLFRFLKGAWEDVKAFFVKQVNGFSQFIAHIGGEIYTAILDCVSAVCNAIEFVFKKIKVFLEQLVAWLGFVFDWDDILRTHRVMKNIFKQYAQNAINKLDDLHASIRSSFDHLRGLIYEEPWDSLGDSGKNIRDYQHENEKVDAVINSPQSNWAVYHISNGLPNVSDSAATGAPSGVDMSSLEELVRILEDAVKEEGELLKQAVHRIKDEVVNKIHDTSPIRAIQKVMAVLGDFLVGTAENIILKLIDLIKIFMSTLLRQFDAHFEIPIISPIYRSITNGDSLSCLDVVCLVAAIPGTLIYKIVTNEAPFPDNATTSSLIKASSFAELSQLLSQPDSQSAYLGTDVPATKGPTLVNKVVGILKVCVVAVTAFSVGLTYLKREIGIPGAIFSALSISLVIVSGGPVIASNFGPIGKWTIVADVMFCIRVGKASLDNTDVLGQDIKALVMPWVGSLLGCVSFVTTIGGFIEKQPPKMSDTIGLVGGIFSSLGTILDPFTSNRIFPETGVFVFAVVLGLKIAGSHFSAASGVASLSE